MGIIRAAVVHPRSILTPPAGPEPTCIAAGVLAREGASHLAHSKQRRHATPAHCKKSASFITVPNPRDGSMLTNSVIKFARSPVERKLLT